MRIPRSIQLHNPQGLIHQYWRCHNREFYLQSSKMKSLYLQCLKDASITHNKDNCLYIQAYTCMDNHFHNLINYNQGSQKLSGYLRQSHSLFGSRYNRLHKRSGKVAESRPKTSLIENTEHQMKVHFYIEANPIRAGKCSEKQLRCYKYSSYRFYAYGVEDEFTKLLTIPTWYMELGTGALQRQYTYRRLFREYLSMVLDRIEFFAPFIGTALWRVRSLQQVSKLLNMTVQFKEAPT